MAASPQLTFEVSSIPLKKRIKSFVLILSLTLILNGMQYAKSGSVSFVLFAVSLLALIPYKNKVQFDSERRVLSVETEYFFAKKMEFPYAAVTNLVLRTYAVPKWLYWFPSNVSLWTWPAYVPMVAIGNKRINLSKTGSSNFNSHEPLELLKQAQAELGCSIVEESFWKKH